MTPQPPTRNHAPLDIENADALRAYLVHTERVAQDEPLEIHVLAGGVSNKTVRVTRPSGEAWVVKQALPKLRVQVDWFADPDRIRHESEGMRHLGRLIPGHIPPLCFEDADHHLLAMTAVPEPHEVWKQTLMHGRGTGEQAARFGQLLGTIHNQAWQQRDRCQPAFRDRRYFESLRLEPYYGFAAQQCPAAAAFFNDLIETTRRQTITLVHGDYSPKNVLVHEGRLILLDHEVIHWGDPAFDVGFSLTHLLSKAHHLPAHRTALCRLAETYWTSYHEAIGDVPWAKYLEIRAVQHTLGCLLARVDGRSPLEYLHHAERDRQRRAVLSLIDHPLRSTAELFQLFLERV